MNREKAIVLAIINVLYLILSAILLIPKNYGLAENPSVFSGGYGVSSAIYSLGILYAFFDKLLTSTNSAYPTKKKRTLAVLSAVFALLSVVLVGIYYFAFPFPCLVWFSYAFLILTGVVAMYEAAALLLDFIHNGDTP